MKSIKDQLDALPDEKRKRLMYAFENGFSQFVETEPGKYLGVNTSNIKNLSVEQCAGSWYSGDIKRGRPE